MIESKERIANTVEFFKAKYISASDEKLISLFFKNNVCQKDLDDFLNNWDIEREGGHKALMLSYFMKTHPELNYPPYIEPRLNGILKYYRFKNIKLLAHYKKICSALKNENIDILIIKGGALKHLNNDFPRIMGDIDILVPEKDYKKAKYKAISFGYRYEEYLHSIDIHDSVTNETLLDIHHKLDMLIPEDYETAINRDFFDRAHQDTVFEVDNIYVPCTEDMMFILLINFYKNMVNCTSFQSFLYAITDCAFLMNMKPNFNWNIVKENTKKTYTEKQISVAVTFINEFIPVKMPEFYIE